MSYEQILNPEYQPRGIILYDPSTQQLTLSKTTRMDVNPALISHLAKLARLSPSPAEAEKLQGDLKNILAMVEKLDELDLQTVEPLRYVTGQVNDLRPDTVGRHIDREAALENAPDAGGGGTARAGFSAYPKS